MHNVKLELEYEGTDFVGWQYQDNGRSVQAELENALRQILQIGIRVIGGGRTDAGVHARGQVANFRVERELDESKLVKSLNGVLPKDIVVLNAKTVDDEFHARYSAKAREYRYYISQRSTALMRKYCWSLDYKLDVDLMRQCSSLLVGEHDYSSFCRSEAEVKHYRCNVLSATWTKEDSMLQFGIRANRFLHGMVRALVGTMVDVGRGYRTIAQFREILDAKNRAAAGMAAPPQGLFLEHIEY